MKPVQLHLENKQVVTFWKSDNLDHIISKDFSIKSMLTECFLMNKIIDGAQTLLNKQFLEHFVWKSTRQNMDYTKKR